MKQSIRMYNVCQTGARATPLFHFASASAFNIASLTNFERFIRFTNSFNATTVAKGKLNENTHRLFARRFAPRS